MASGQPLVPAGSAQALPLWRAVEAQHQVSTNVLVDTLAEQAELERLLEESKPAPPAGRELHWLLSTPFRYPPLAGGSRFRGPADPGAWYGADTVRTACAEVGYWRWRFLRASPQLSALPARAQTVFRVAAAGRTVDLRLPPLDALRGRFTAPADYTATQSFARRARRAWRSCATNRCATPSTVARPCCSRRRRSVPSRRWSCRPGCSTYRLRA